MNDQPKVCMANGEPVDPCHREISPVTGMQKGYVVLCPEERFKGFARPVRRSYRHVGRSLRGVLELLDSPYTSGGRVYVAVDRFELPGGSEAGAYLTSAEVEQLRKTGRYSGCGTITTMGQALAETFARDPKFYTGTFCCGCRRHFPVAEFLWEPDGAEVGS